MRLLGEIARQNARRFPDKTALICDEDSLTFAQLDAASDAIAQDLLGRGVAVGDRVAILAENCLEYLPVYFGVMKVGAVAVPLNFRSTLPELSHMLGDSGPVILFATPAFLEVARDLTARLGGFELIEMGPGVLSLPPAPPTQVELDEHAPAVILYTSGTTGLPKGAVLSHRSLVETSGGIALATGVREPHRAVVAVPLFHGGGLYVVGHSHLYVGASLIIVRKFAPRDVVALIDRHQATTFFGVSAQYAMLLDSADGRTGAPGQLRNGWYGAAPMPIEIVRRAQQMWPQVRFQQLYGQTETTLIAVLAPEDHDRKLGCTGRAIPGVDMRVVDEQGADCAQGVVGEVIVRQEAGMSGYFRSPEKTAETIREGWIHTGDLGFLDEEQFLTLVDRKRDVIMSGGENIYPKEIEEILYAHEAVLEAAVIGVADPRWGEMPLAFVVMRQGYSLTEEDFHQWCSGRLARYKVPRAWRFVEVLPKTANGKVQKPELRRLFREEA